MSTETLKISIAQRILNISDAKLLKKIANLLDAENVIGFDADGNPITDKAYSKDLHEALQLLEENKLETYTTEEVKRRVLG